MGKAFLIKPLVLALCCFVSAVSAWESGQLIPHKLVSHQHGGSSEWIPDFDQIANFTIVQSGYWSDLVSTSETNIVLIPSGVYVTYDLVSTQRFKALVVQGCLTFDPTIDTRMTVGTIIVEGGGIFLVEPMSRTVTSTIVFSGPLDTNEDPRQFGNGLVSNGGNISIAGTPQETPTTTGTASAGASVLSVGSTDGWQAGDMLVFPDQQLGATPAYWAFNYVPQTERRSIASVFDNQVTLASPLAYNHGTTSIGHLTRNVIFQSEPGSPRAHILFTGHSFVEFNHAVIMDCGRTAIAERDDTTMSTNGTPIHVGANQRARYALHAHHVHEPVMFHGNVIIGQNTGFGSERFGIVLHDSRGDVRSNIVVGARGSSIFLEDGVETGDVAENLLIGTGGGTGLGDDIRFSPLLGEDMGAGGFGIWARGTLVRIKNNVAAGYFTQAAYAYFTHGNFASGIVPDIPGNPPELIGQQIRLGQMPIQTYGAFDGNRAIGLFKHAMEISYQQTVGTLLKNSAFTMLNKDGTGLHVIHCNEIILDHPVMVSATGGYSIGAYNNSGLGGRLTIINGSFSGFYVAIPTFPQGGSIQASFQGNSWNIVMNGGSGLVDILGYYAGGNYRLFDSAQPGSIVLPGVYGYALLIP